MNFVALALAGFYRFFYKLKNIVHKCFLITCMSSSCIYTLLATTWHTPDDSSDVISVYGLSFLNKGIGHWFSTFSRGCGLRLTRLESKSHRCSIGFRAGDLAGQSITVIICVEYRPPVTPLPVLVLTCKVQSCCTVLRSENKACGRSSDSHTILMESIPNSLVA